MKKIYISLFALSFATFSQAQTLTQTTEPVPGDVSNKNGYDSVGVIPKTAGTGQAWNFSAFTQNTVTANSVYNATTSVPQSSAYPGTTVVEDEGGGSLNFWKSTSTPTTQFELNGSIVQGALNVSYSNTVVYAIWPMSMGFSNTDLFSGNATGSFNGPVTGTISVDAIGTGTLTLPGGGVFTNVLLVKTISKTVLTQASPPATITINTTNYGYYHSSQKQPLVGVTYQANTGSPLKVDTKINASAVTGVNEFNFDATFQIYPNPAKEYFHVNLANVENKEGKIEIVNVMGQVAKEINLGNASTLDQKVSLEGLSSGVYTVKTTVGTRTSSRKLIVD
jgi:hypothetical protein